MQFALFTSGEFMEWNELVDLWKYAEQSGWDAVFIDDHFMPDSPNPVGDYLECWTSLAGLSQLTERIRIGTLVTGNPYRHPALLAKMAANVDVMSGGRLIFGLGAGWQENEHLAYGIPFDPPGTRLDKLEEACQVILSLWEEDRANFQGDYYVLRDAPLQPKPAQNPHPEFLIGGGGIKRTLLIAAKYADHWNDWGGPQNFAYKTPYLEQHCNAVGRPADEITRSACMALQISENKSDIESLHARMMKMFDYDSEQASDAILAGSTAEIQDKIFAMEDVGIEMICIPTFVRDIPTKELDRFMNAVATSF